MDTNDSTPGFGRRLKNFFIGEERSLSDKTVFQHISLIAFFAWVGLGADGLSSSCYGPEEAFHALHGHSYLAIFVAIAAALTIFVISSSYTQIIKLFPTGGGGYLVASKLLSPKLGMISGCALVIDYILTVAISIASGADAVFSFLPPEYAHYKFIVTSIGLIVLTIMNLRGVRESVIALTPIFMVFIVTHLFAIIYAQVSHFGELDIVVTRTTQELNRSFSELGVWGTIFLILKAFSTGAGTFTGIEAVSNGLPILREPKVETASKTMRYMAFSLAFTVLGLMLAYVLFDVHKVEGKTLNAVMLESMTRNWGVSGTVFVYVTLISEAALLFVAAQAGFLDGPRVLSNMAVDRWFPSKFATLSDRLVTQNGVLLMAIAAFLMLLLTGGKVQYLIVLYSINVFVTFTLSQLGMVRHWWEVRGKEKNWQKGLAINGTGLFVTAFILIAVTVSKFMEGGWITIVITGGMVLGVLAIRRHYEYTRTLLKRLDDLVLSAIDVSQTEVDAEESTQLSPNYREKTAVFLVSGFSGMGLHTLFTVLRSFEGTFKNFVFLQVGVLDAGNFKGAEEIDSLQAHISTEAGKYVNFMKKNGFYAEAFCSLGTDAVEEIAEVAPQITKKFPNAIFFGGQLVFPNETIFSRWLHNYTVFSIQRRLHYKGIPVVTLPIMV